MSHRTNSLTPEEQRKANAAKLSELRTAAKEGFDAIDRGEYTLIRSEEEHKKFFDEIAAEVRDERAAKKER